MKDFEFDFEKLDVYQKSLDFIDKIFVVYQNLSQNYKISIGSNLIRAALSVSNNLAEGNGKRSIKEKTRYFSISLDSTRECLSVLNVLKRQNLIDDNEFNKIRSYGKEITSMVWGLINAI